MDFQNVPIVVTSIPDGFKVAFIGPIHINVTWIERELEKVVAAKPKLVELDLTQTPYVSSLGIGVLVSLRNSIVVNGGSARVVAIDSRAFTVLRYAHLTKSFEIQPSAVVTEGT